MTRYPLHQRPRVVYTSLATRQIPNDYRLFNTSLSPTRLFIVNVVSLARTRFAYESFARSGTFRRVYSRPTIRLCTTTTSAHWHKSCLLLPFPRQVVEWRLDIWGGQGGTHKGWSSQDDLQVAYRQVGRVDHRYVPLLG
jgi:hypothetical protein